MHRDFTLNRYRSLIGAAAAAIYTPTTVQDYLASPPGRCLILRHDVDRAPGRALDMARVEEEMGVRGSYYFRRWAEDNKMIKHSASHLNRLMTVISNT